MNTRLLIVAARQHRLVLITGAILGVLLAVASLYSVRMSPDQGLKFTERRTATYESSVQLLISDSRFAIGRAGIEQDAPDSFERMVWLTPSYSQLIQGDTVRRAAAKIASLRGVTIASVPLEKSPIVKLTAKGGDRQRVLDAANAYVVAFRDYLERSQKEHEVPERDRVIVTKLSGPTVAPPAPSRKLEIGMAAFLVPFLAAVGIAYFVENMEAGGRA